MDSDLHLAPATPVPVPFISLNVARSIGIGRAYISAFGDLSAEIVVFIAGVVLFGFLIFARSI